MRHPHIPTMDGVHSMDVSWLHHAKEHHGPTRAPNASPPSSTNSNTATAPPPKSSKSPQAGEKSIPNGSDKSSPASTTAPKPIPAPVRPGFNRTNSGDKTGTSASPKNAPSSPSPGTSRRNSWLSSLSSKFSSQGQNGAPQISSPASQQQPQEQIQRPPGGNAPKNAVLQHASRNEGDAPYVPAPPRSSHPNFLASALRRFSSGGGQLGGAGYKAQHGLCERKILNVDRNRDRCRVTELDQNKLRRVAFCVDVEIAAAPHYKDDDLPPKKEQVKKKKVAEKGEGEALKNPEGVKNEKETDGVLKSTGEKLPKEPAKEGTDNPTATTTTASTTPADASKPAVPAEPTMTRKKEKKKRSEEERKARKEKRRKQAVANGTIPVEHMIDLSDSSEDCSTPPTGAGTPRPTQVTPTIDPVRIYRRCCQLRETPILKKITEQLMATSNRVAEKPGFVNRLDLTNYNLNLSDLTTLGDYLAVVPIKEIILENCNLTDEGVRIVLSGLLDSKPPQTSRKRRKNPNTTAETRFQGGVVERVVLKNNPKIGREGWRYISTFIHLSRSLRFIDLSMNPFPKPLYQQNSSEELSRRTSPTSSRPELHCTFAKAVADRLGGSTLELLNLAETGITTEQLSVLVDGLLKLGLRRLGLAGNNLTAEGIEQVARYLRGGKCEGLDLGSNNLNEHLDVIADALVACEAQPIWALSLAKCNLTPDAMWKLVPALAKLDNLRFIDFSHNHELFSIHPSALSVLRRYLPKMPILKRIHLTDVSMSPEQAIALTEILPECPELAHVNLMENPELTALAKAKDEANQEEACAFYASLMAATRVSKSIVCIDVDVPAPESSEVVKALAKQVIAYCLRNMERGHVSAFSDSANVLDESQDPELAVPVPDVLLHLVGQVDGYPEVHDDDEPAPDQDYVIGSQGLVKALDICLNRKDQMRPPTQRHDSGVSEHDSSTPAEAGKAMTMSKNLLESARKIRSRLQPALLRERKAGDSPNYMRLLFLDQTLQSMIQRFEDEFPETRLPAGQEVPRVTVSTTSPSISIADGDSESHVLDPNELESACAEGGVSDDDGAGGIRPVLSRHNSDVSLFARAQIEEEGRMHRFGHQFRQDIASVEGDSGKRRVSEEHHRQQDKHLQLLREMLADQLEGEEIQRIIESGDRDAIFEELTQERSLLRQRLIDIDPEAWERFVESQDAAKRNKSVSSSDAKAAETAVED